MDKIRIACIGRWAGHSMDFAKAIQAREDCELVAVWDEDNKKACEWAELLGAPCAGDIHRLLQSDEIDAVCVTCGTAKHAPILIEASRNGKHIFVEKALASVNEDAYAIREAVLESGIHFTMSDPVFRGGLRYIKRMADSGFFGEVTEVRYRTLNDRLLKGLFMDTAYDNSENGGGCMIDMGHHSAHILSWFLGKPVRARALTVPWTEEGKAENVEEFSVAIYEFENHALGIAESGWLGPKYQFEFNIYGTKGCACALRREDDDEKLKVMYCREGEGWTEVPSEEIDGDLLYPMDYWIQSIKENTANSEYGIDEAVRLTEMITAGYLSDRQELPQKFTL